MRTLSLRKIRWFTNSHANNMAKLWFKPKSPYYKSSVHLGEVCYMCNRKKKKYVCKPPGEDRRSLALLTLKKKLIYSSSSSNSYFVPNYNCLPIYSMTVGSLWELSKEVILSIPSIHSFIYLHCYLLIIYLFILGTTFFFFIRVLSALVNFKK